MKKTLTLALAATAVTLTLPAVSSADPHQDQQKFQHFFEQRFPNTTLQEFANGSFAKGIGSADAISQLQDMMSFPPFDPADGKALFDKPFPNGKTYASCFKHGGIGIAQNYPYVDNATGQVVTLEGAINQCRVDNGLKRLPWKKGKLAKISEYMKSTSAGKPFDIKTPTTPAELKAYEAGKHFFYAKRGQLNMSCADCHETYSGQRIRSQTLAPALGITSGFPTYRAKWGRLGTIDWRFMGCNKNVRAKPFKPQSKEYRDLEYFLAYMSNGVPLNAPQWRP